MTATQQAINLANIAARAAASIKAEEIIALDVSEQLVLTDIFLIASGSNERQVGAIVDAVEEALYKAGSKRIRREGKAEGRWVLLDFGDIVVHVQHAEDRVYYALERLWRDCPVVPLNLNQPAGDDADGSQADDAAGSDASDSGGANSHTA